MNVVTVLPCGPHFFHPMQWRTGGNNMSATRGQHRPDAIPCIGGKNVSGTRSHTSDIDRWEKEQSKKKDVNGHWYYSETH